MRLRPHSWRLVLTALALLGTGVGGCGDEPEPRPAATPQREAPVARSLPPVAPEARARFALARIATGPLPRTGAFVIEGRDRLNLEQAMRDLIAMPQQTIALLSEPDVWMRYAGPEVRNLDPLHAIVDVLTAIDPKPTDLAIRWAEPALASAYLQLRRRATKLLATLRDAAAGPLLLDALERNSSDLETGNDATRALAALGSPWRERMVEIVLRQGTPDRWERLPTLLAEVGPQGLPRAEADDLLAWWALLAETGGPRLPHPGAARSTIAPWSAARLYLDPVMQAIETAADGPPRILPTGPLPAGTLDASGTIPLPHAASSVLVPDVVTLSGRSPGAETRCLLAGRGHRPHQESVEADLGVYDEKTKTGDAIVYFPAKHCTYRPPQTPEQIEKEKETVLSEVVKFLAKVRQGNAPPGEEVHGSVGALPTLGDEGLELLVALLRDLRPATTYRPLLSSVHKMLDVADHDRAVAEVTRLLESSASQDIDLARHLIQQSRDPDLLPALEAWIARSPDSNVDHWRTLWWIVSSGRLEPARVDAFTRKYARHIDEQPDDRAALLATGLLDLGDTGVRAYAERLRGPRRRIFVQGLVSLSRTVPLEVAEALLEPVDARTPAEERHAAWSAAYRTAPPEAAGALAAALDRVDPAARQEAVDVLEAVRHRAPRSGHTR